MLFGCSPDNVPDNTSSLVLNAKTKNFANIGNITGTDEVWFNAGDNRYYTGSSSQLDANGNVIAVLGVIDAIENLLIETVPQGSDSHSVAADSLRNRIFRPASRSGGARRQRWRYHDGWAGDLRQHEWLCRGLRG